MDEKGVQHTIFPGEVVVDAPPEGARVIAMTDEEIARAPLPDGDAAVKVILKGVSAGRSKSIEYELTADGRLMKVLDPSEILAPEEGSITPRNEGSMKDNSGVSRQEGDEESAHPDGDVGIEVGVVDLLAERSDYFSDDAMEFILSAIDSGVDERAVRKMIDMDEGELLRICGEVG